MVIRDPPPVEDLGFLKVVADSQVAGFVRESLFVQPMTVHKLESGLSCKRKSEIITYLLLRVSDLLNPEGEELPTTLCAFKICRLFRD